MADKRAVHKRPRTIFPSSYAGIKISVLAIAQFGRTIEMVRWASVGYAGLFVGALLASAPVHALEVKPGLWEITTQGVAEALKACFTQEFLDTDISDMKMPEGVECRNEIREKSSKLVITHSVCSGTFAIEGDTRLDVLSPESMTMQSTSVMNFGGQEQALSTSAQYKWLSSDCGDVKPIDLQN